MLALLFICGLHISILRSLPANVTIINKLTGTLLQVVGGLVVLHAVNQNLGLFRQESLLTIVVTWLRDVRRPKPKAYVISPQTGHYRFSGHAPVVFQRGGMSLDERIAAVEGQVNELRTLLSSSSSELRHTIETTKIELSASIATQSEAVQKLSDQVERATVGGFKEQAFGVLLAVYGAVVSVFA